MIIGSSCLQRRWRSRKRSWKTQFPSTLFTNARVCVKNDRIEIPSISMYIIVLVFFLVFVLTSSEYNTKRLINIVAKTFHFFVLTTCINETEVLGVIRHNTLPTRKNVSPHRFKYIFIRLIRVMNVSLRFQYVVMELRKKGEVRNGEPSRPVLGWLIVLNVVVIQRRPTVVFVNFIELKMWKLILQWCCLVVELFQSFHVSYTLKDK